MDQMIVVCQAVRRGVRRALLSCDFPFGPVQEGSKSAVRAAIRFVKEAGVDMVKLDGASDHLDAVTAVTRAGIPVFAQFGITPQTALKYGVTYSATPTAGDAVPDEFLDEMVGEAKRLEDAGAALLNFTNSGPVVGPAVAAGRLDPGGRWIRRRTVAGRPDPDGHRGDRLQRGRAGQSAGHLRQRRPDRARRRSRPTPTTCGRRARSPVGSGSERVHGGDRRDRHALRGGGLRPAAVDVLAGWIRRHHGQLGKARAVSPHSDAGAAAGTVQLHHLRQARVGRVGRPGRAGALDGLRQPGRRAARPSGPGTRPHHGRVRRLFDCSAFGDDSPGSGGRHGAVLAGRRGEVPNETACAVRGSSRLCGGERAGWRRRAGGHHRRGLLRGRQGGAMGDGAAPRSRIQGALRRVGPRSLPDDRRRDEQIALRSRHGSRAGAGRSTGIGDSGTDRAWAKTARTRRRRRAICRSACR